MVVEDTEAVVTEEEVVVVTTTVDTPMCTTAGVRTSTLMVIFGVQGLLIAAYLAFARRYPFATDDRGESLALLFAALLAVAAFLSMWMSNTAATAVLAVSATLAVVEPYGSGLGGGGFYLLHRAADGRQWMLDARERAPLAAHRDMYLDADGKVIPGLSVNGASAAAYPLHPTPHGPQRAPQRDRRHSSRMLSR